MPNIAKKYGFIAGYIPFISTFYGGKLLYNSAKEHWKHKVSPVAHEAMGQESESPELEDLSGKNVESMTYEGWRPNPDHKARRGFSALVPLIGNAILGVIDYLDYRDFKKNKLAHEVEEELDFSFKFKPLRDLAWNDRKITDFLNDEEIDWIKEEKVPFKKFKDFYEQDEEARFPDNSEDLHALLKDFREEMEAKEEDTLTASEDIVDVEGELKAFLAKKDEVEESEEESSDTTSSDTTTTTTAATTDSKKTVDSIVIQFLDEFGDLEETENEEIPENLKEKWDDLYLWDWNVKDAEKMESILPWIIKNQVTYREYALFMREFNRRGRIEDIDTPGLFKQAYAFCIEQNYQVTEEGIKAWFDKK